MRIYKLMLGALLNICLISGMEKELSSSSSSDPLAPAAQHITIWNPTHIAQRLARGGNHNMRKVVMRQTRILLYMVQNVRFCDLDTAESYAFSLANGCLNHFKTSVQLSDTKSMQDDIHAYWIYLLAEIRAALQKKKEPSLRELLDYSWKLRLCIQDIAAPQGTDPLEEFDPKNSRIFLPIVTKSLIQLNGTLITNLLRLNLFNRPVSGPRRTYTAAIIERLPPQLHTSKLLFTGTVKVVTQNDDQK